MHQNRDENAKISIREKLSYASGQGGGVVLSTLFGSFLLSYYTDTVLIDAAAIATMYLIVRVFDGISDFIVGALVDKTNTKFGKARPWILLSAPMMAIGIALVFAINKNWANSSKLIYAYLTYIFVNVIAYTVFNIAHFSLLAKMTMNGKERTDISTIAMVVNNIVQIILGAVFAPLIAKVGWGTAAICAGVLSGVLILIEFLGTKERVAVDDNPGEAEQIPLGQAVKSAMKNKYFFLILILNAMILIMNVNSIQSMIYYCNNILNNPMYISALLSIGNIPSLVILFVIPFLTRKFSKQRVMVFCSLMLILSFVLMGVAGMNYSLIMIGVILKNIAVSPMFALPMAMTADLVDYSEYKTGFRSVGIINSGSSIGAKVGIGLGGAVTGWILAASGYDGAVAIQSDAALNGIKFAFSWSGLIMSAVILIVVLLLDIEKKLPEIQRELAARHAAKERSQA